MILLAEGINPHVVVSKILRDKVSSAPLAANALAG